MFGLFSNNKKQRIIFLEDCLLDVMHNINVEQLSVLTGNDRNRCYQIKMVADEIKQRRNIRNGY